MKKLDLFIRSYNKKYFELSQINEDVLNKIKKFYKLILDVKKKKKNYNCWQWWKCCNCQSF